MHDFHRGHIALDAHVAAQNFLCFGQTLYIVKTESADSGFLQKMPEFSAGAADVQAASCTVTLDEIHILLEVRQGELLIMAGADQRRGTDGICKTNADFHIDQSLDVTVIAKGEKK